MRCLALLLLAATWLHADEPLLGHVEKRGEGPIPMVLIHSLWCDWTVWDEFMSRNEARYTMYAVTLAGCGGTDAPPLPEDPDDYTGREWSERAAKGVIELIKEESLEDVVLVGHYSGGQLALRLALEHPIYFSKVVTIDGEPATPLRGSQGGATREERDAIVNKKMGAEHVPDDMWRSTLRVSANQAVTNPGRAAVIGDVMAMTTFQTGKRYLLEMHAEDLTDRISGLRMPVLAIVPISPDLADDQADRVYDRWLGAFRDVDDVQILFFDDSRQFVMYDEPEKLDEAIADFVIDAETDPESPETP